MRNLSSGMRIVLVAALSVFPYLLGTVLTLFDVWVDVLALLPLLVVTTCVYFNVAESTGVFLLLQGIQLLCAHGYSWLLGRSYSSYLIGKWVSSDVAEFGAVALTVLTVVDTIPLAIAKAVGKGSGVGKGVTTLLLLLAGVLLMPSVLFAVVWIAAQLLVR